MTPSMIWMHMIFDVLHSLKLEIKSAKCQMVIILTSMRAINKGFVRKCPKLD